MQDTDIDTVVDLILQHRRQVVASIIQMRCPTIMALESLQPDFFAITREVAFL